MKIPFFLPDSGINDPQARAYDRANHPHPLVCLSAPPLEYLAVIAWTIIVHVSGRQRLGLAFTRAPIDKSDQ